MLCRWVSRSCSESLVCYSGHTCLHWLIRWWGRLFDCDFSLLFCILKFCLTQQLNYCIKNVKHKSKSSNSLKILHCAYLFLQHHLEDPQGLLPFCCPPARTHDSSQGNIIRRHLRQWNWSVWKWSHQVEGEKEEGGQKSYSRLRVLQGPKISWVSLLVWCPNCDW